MNTETVDPNLGQQPTAIVTALGINQDEAQSRANLEGDAFLARTCKIHIISGSIDHLGEWWLASGHGTTRDPNLACLFSVRTALVVMGRDTELVLCGGEEPPLTATEVMGLQQEAITAQTTEVTWLTSDQAMYRVRAEATFAERMCKIQDSDSGRWWLEWGGGLVPLRDSAHVYTVREAIQVMNADARVVLWNRQIDGDTPPVVTDEQPNIPLREGEFMLTAWDAKRAPADRRCIVVDTGAEVARYWDNDNDMTLDRELAMVFTNTAEAVAEIEEEQGEELSSGNPSLTMKLIILPPPVLATGERSVITQFLQPQIIEMLRSAPLNPVVRTQVHARILVPLPDTADTFEKIKEWIETTIKGRGGPVPAPLPRTRVPVPPPPPTQDLFVRVEVTETTRGRARYSVNRVGGGSYALTRTEIRRIANEVIEDDGDMDQLVDRIDDLAREKCSENYPDMAPDDEGYEYSHHEDNVDEDNNSEMTVEPNRGLAGLVRDWLRANEPELNAQLDDDPVF